MSEENHSREYIQWLNSHIGERIRLWMGGVALVYLIPAAVIAYQLGSISDTIEDAENSEDINYSVNRVQNQWMRCHEVRWNAISAWAQDEDTTRPAFVPPRYTNCATVLGLQEGIQ